MSIVTEKKIVTAEVPKPVPKHRKTIFICLRIAVVKFFTKRPSKGHNNQGQALYYYWQIISIFVHEFLGSAIRQVVVMCHVLARFSLAQMNQKQALRTNVGCRLIQLFHT